MTKKIVFGVAVVAFAALTMAPTASATCAGVRTASTYNSGTQGYLFWSPVAGDPIGPGGPALVGNVWQAGAPANYLPFVGIAACNNDFLYFGATGVGLNLHMESCGQGCPAPNSNLAVLAQHETDPANGGPVGFLLATVTETADHAINFDYSTVPYTLARLATPVVTSSSPAAGSVSATVTIPSHAAGLVGPSGTSSFTGYRVVEAQSVGNPGNDAATYSLVLATIPAAGGAAGPSTPIVVACAGTVGTGKDAWIATQLSFENGAVLSQVVSQPRRVHCDGALANPKYTTVPKKVVGPAPTSH